MVEILHVTSQRGEIVAEVLVQFTDVIQDEEGRGYTARVCGDEMPGKRWQGWIEFLPADGGEAIRSGRETTQPNRTAVEYWATGLTAVYLEGALKRALKPFRPPPEPVIPPPVFDAPASPHRSEDLPSAHPAESVLDPFSVYRKGEASLRSQLGALSTRHLVNIILAHRLSDTDTTTLNLMPPSALIEIIVAGVRQPRSPARQTAT
jgi:hypothetical protein